MILIINLRLLLAANITSAIQIELIGTTEHPLTEFISQEGIDGNWSRNEGTGYLYPASEGSGGALVRGGNWNDGDQNGVFRASLQYSPSDSFNALGFRCVRL